MHCRNFPYRICTVLLFTPCTARSLLIMKSPLPPAGKAWSSWCWHPVSGSTAVAQGHAFAIAKPNAAIKPHPLARLPAGSRPAAAPAPLTNTPGREAHASTQPGLPGSEGEPGMPQRWQSRRTCSTRGAGGAMPATPAQLHPKELVVSPPQTGSRFPGWVEDCDTSTSPWPPLGPPVPGGWAAGFAPVPVPGWQQVHRVPRLL